MAEKCKNRTGYDTCTKGVIPGDYFHNVELPYIYRRDSDIDVQRALQKPRFETEYHQNQRSDFSTTENTAPCVQKIAV